MTNITNTPGFLSGCFMKTTEIDDRFKVVSVPVYTIHAEKDGATYYESKDIFAQIGLEKMRELQCEVITYFIPMPERFMTKVYTPVI